MVRVFVEGPTEERLLKVLKARFGLDDFRVLRADGKDKLNPMVAEALGPDLIEGNDVRCLVVRDCDPGESAEGLTRALSVRMDVELKKRGTRLTGTFERTGEHPEVFVLRNPKPQLRMVMHVAVRPWRPGLTGCTIDDYVLTAAMQTTTAKALIDRYGKFTASPDDVIRKVAAEIPEMLERNGLPLQQAKAFVRIYAAIMQMDTSPPLFAEVVATRAPEADLRAAFAPLLRGLEEAAT